MCLKLLAGPPWLLMSGRDPVMTCGASAGCEGGSMDWGRRGTSNELTS